MKISTLDDLGNQVENSLAHYLPLRPDFTVRVILPRNLTKPEAQKVCRWIAALAVVEAP